MNFDYTDEQNMLRDSIAKWAAGQYDFEKRKAALKSDDGWKANWATFTELGLLAAPLPEEYGGSGLGITEAALLMQTVAESGAALQGASAIHLNIFGPNPIVVFGTEEQKKRILPDIIKGKVKGCFAVTEPDAGLNTTALDTKAERDGNGYIVHGKKTWTTTAQVADKMLLIARTTPKEKCRRATDGLSLFFASTVFVVFGAGLLAPKLARRWGQVRAARTGILIALAGSLALLLGWEEVYYFSFAITVFLMGMGMINPLGTAITMQPFGQKAGAASALLGFLQMGCAAIAIGIAASLPVPVYAAFCIVLAANLGLSLLVFWSVSPSQRSKT